MLRRGTRNWNRLVVALLVLTGLSLTLLTTRQIADSNFRLWQVASIGEAERMSSTIQYRVMREREPLIATASLYSGSEEVTQNELREARRRLIRMSGLNIPYSLAFLTPEADGGFLVRQAAGELSLLPAEPFRSLDPQLIPTARAALENRPGLITGALLRSGQTSYLPLAIASENAGREGVLIYLANFTALLNEATREVLGNGMALEIRHPETGNFDHAGLPPLESPAEASHRIDLDMGLYDWQLDWQFDADYEAAIDERLVYVVLLTGTVITLLLALAIHTLLQRGLVIRNQVRQRTRELQRTQQRLVQQERMAALGDMVAGISHELNTPIGNSLMAAGLLQKRSAELQREFEEGQLGRQQFEEYLAIVEESGKAIEHNANRASELITSFKQVAVDQSSERRRSFDLGNMLKEVVKTLRPRIRKTPHTLSTSLPEGIVMNSYPGPIGQIINNLVLNAVEHAFEPGQSGHMRLEIVREDSGTALIRFSDDGCGVDPSIRHKVFDPFFTTSLGQGGSGLGLHIVYTMVTTILAGEIVLRSPAKGTCFDIHLPLEAPEADTSREENRNTGRRA